MKSGNHGDCNETMAHLEKQVHLLQNELKNQDLKFKQQIEKMLGDLQTRDARMMKFIENGEYPSDEEIGPDGLPIEGSKSGTKSISQRSKMKVLSDKVRDAVTDIVETKVTSMKKEALQRQAVRKTASKYNVSKKNSSIDASDNSRSKSNPRGRKYQPEATG